MEKFFFDFADIIATYKDIIIRIFRRGGYFINCILNQITNNIKTK